MRTGAGCELGFQLTQPTPLIAMLNVHYSRACDLQLPDHLTTKPPVPIGNYRDGLETGAAASLRRLGYLLLA